MVGITLLCIGSITMLCVFWWCVKCYFGPMFATFITCVVIAVIVVALNSIANEPTQHELDYYERQRRGKGR